MRTAATHDGIAAGTDRADDPSTSDRSHRDAAAPGRWIAVLVAVLAVAGAALTLVMTRDGIGGGPDAAGYIGVTDNVARGHGVTIPFVTYTEHYGPARAASFGGEVPLVLAPPVYPVVAGIVEHIGDTDPVDATRIVNALAVLAGLLVAGWMLLTLTRGWIATAGGLVLVLLAPAENVFNVTQSWLGLAAGPSSEVPYIAATIVSLAALALYLARGGRLWAVLLVASIALAILLRYAGMSSSLTAAIAIVWLGRGRWPRRFVSAVAVGVVSFVPAIAWNLGNAVFYGASSPRLIVFHPPEAEALRQSALAVASWWLPGSGGGLRFVALGLVVAAIIAALWGGLRTLPLVRPVDAADRAATRDLGPLLYRGLLVFIPCYYAVLVVTRTFFDAGVPLHGKSLAPLQPVLIVATVAGLSRTLAAATRGRPRLVNDIVVAVVVVLVAWVGWHATWRALRDSYPSPYQSRATSTMRAIRNLPSGTLIATNAPDAVYVSAQRSSIVVPLHRDNTTTRTNTRYGAQARELRRVLARRRGTLVLFRVSPIGKDLPALLGLVPTQQLPGAAFYVVPPAGSAPAAGVPR